METLVIVVHMLAALAIIGLILLQQGKGAEMGASFGAGASQTLFGSQGSGNFFSRMTAFIAVVFFATSFALAVIAKEKSSVGDSLDIPLLDERDIPAVEQPAPQSEVPAVEAPSAPSSDVPAVESNQQPTEAEEVPEAPQQQ